MTRDQEALQEHLARFDEWAKAKVISLAPGGCCHTGADALRSLLAEAFDLGAQSMKIGLDSLASAPAPVEAELRCLDCGATPSESFALCILHAPRYSQAAPVEARPDTSTLWQCMCGEWFKTHEELTAHRAALGDRYVHAPPAKCWRCGDAEVPGHLVLAGKGGALVPCPYCQPGEAVKWMEDRAAPVESAPGACTCPDGDCALHPDPNDCHCGQADCPVGPRAPASPPAEPGTCPECAGEGGQEVEEEGTEYDSCGYPHPVPARGFKRCPTCGGTGRRDTPPLPAEPGTCPVHKEHKAQQVDRPCRKCGTGPVFFHDGMGSTTTDEHWWCLKCGAEGYVDGIDS